MVHWRAGGGVGGGGGPAGTGDCTDGGERSRSSAVGSGLEGVGGVRSLGFASQVPGLPCQPPNRNRPPPTIGPQRQWCVA